MLVMKNYLSYAIDRTQILITIFHFFPFYVLDKYFTRAFPAVRNAMGSDQSPQSIFLI